MTRSVTPRLTPLNALHRSLGARLVDFHGWEMPVQYTGVIDEHLCVREAVGIFDLSHMGEFKVAGPGATAYLQGLLTNDVARLEDGHALYSVLCNEDGGIIDDLITYRRRSEEYLVVVNAANIEKDFEWFRAHRRRDMTVEDVTEQIALIAVQGPRAAQVLQPLVSRRVDDLYYYCCRGETVSGVDLVLARTGYTGEDGFEMYVGAENAVRVWNLLWEHGERHGMKPVGLGARDTLRLEMAYSLYGYELTEEVDPFEARLGWVVALEKDEFIGRNALVEKKARGPSRRIAGFVLEEAGVPRAECAVVRDGRCVGRVTSGTMSPSLKRRIGLAMLERDSTKVGTEVRIQVRGRTLRARIAKTPFCPSRVYRVPRSQ